MSSDPQCRLCKDPIYDRRREWEFEGSQQTYICGDCAGKVMILFFEALGMEQSYVTSLEGFEVDWTDALGFFRSMDADIPGRQLRKVVTIPVERIAQVLGDQFFWRSEA